MSAQTENMIAVMVVDDESSIRDTAAHHLKRQGYDVRTFPSADECVPGFR